MAAAAGAGGGMRRRPAAERRGREVELGFPPDYSCLISMIHLPPIGLFWAQHLNGASLLFRPLIADNTKCILC